MQTRQARAARERRRKLAYSYASSAGTRVVIVDKRGLALVDTSARVPGTESFASRPEIARALQGVVASGTRSSATLHTRLLYVAVPVASGGVVQRRGADHVPDLGGHAHPPLLAPARCDRVGRPRRGRARRPPARPLRHPAAARARGRPRQRSARATSTRARRSWRGRRRCARSRASSTRRSSSSSSCCARRRSSSPTRRTSCARRSPRCGCGSRTSSSASTTRAAAISTPPCTRSSGSRETVETLLALARADAGAAPASAVDVEELVRERVEAWRALAEERGVALVAADEPRA